MKPFSIFFRLFSIQLFFGQNTILHPSPSSIILSLSGLSLLLVPTISISLVEEEAADSSTSKNNEKNEKKSSIRKLDDTFPFQEVQSLLTKLTNNKNGNEIDPSKASESSKSEQEEDDKNNNEEAMEASKLVTSYLFENIQSRITNMYQNKAKSPHCRTKIANHFYQYINAIATESPMPFTDGKFHNTCPEPSIDFDNLPKNVSLSSIMLRKYQPPKEDAVYIENANDLILLYGILTHNTHISTIRLIEALQDNYSSDNSNRNGTTLFVVHVDGKESSDHVYDALIEYAMDKDHVHIVPNEYRVRVNWGGYSMVNATMQILKYSFALLQPLSSTSTSTSTVLKEPLQFHKFLHISSSTYPIKSNTEIRNTLASYPIDANMLSVVMKPISPNPASWHYFVECDDAVHRIYRLQPLSKDTNHGIDQYMSSQWFVISHEFAKYLAFAEQGTLVQQYIEYAKHVVVADEGFFGTVLRNSEFCTKHENTNFLHLQFDIWESDLENIQRDQRKCLMPDPDRCGRSPTILSSDYLFGLEISNDLFARKFSDEEESKVKDILDIKRAKAEAKFRDIAAGNFTEGLVIDTSFEGHGTLIVAKETIHDDEPLCLGLGPKGNKVRLVPCFLPEVVSVLSSDWATGAVIEEEVLPNSRWEVGPCSSDGMLQRDHDTAEMIMTKGIYTPGGPHCLIKQIGGIRNGRCLDIESNRIEPGGQVEVFLCMNKWHQMFGFGDDSIAPSSSIFGSVPNHIVNSIKNKSGKHQPSFLCLGVSGRGGKEYMPWKEDSNKVQFNTVDFMPMEELKNVYNNDNNNNNNADENDDHAHDENKNMDILPLRFWKGKQLVTIPCDDDDRDAILDLIFVPFIVEDNGDDNDNANAKDKDTAGDDNTNEMGKESRHENEEL
mmetsp:Transcript_351/g.369  ORF Transcript_351/g.369 Transcript_351/m.369 type:complete len:894 (-) Transcript_351:102-2783(-)